VALPAATPVTIPDELPTVAFEPSLLDQVPPVVASDSVEVAASHTVEGPEILFTELTVAIVSALQPVESAYVIIDVPEATPVTIPVDEPTVATPVVPLVHVPPEGVELSVVVSVAHTEAVPVILVGTGFTVT
jgi:hypothetical protein